ncbi:MAG: hypothetical protein AB7E96_07995 [Deferribacterales bacterium]
MESLIQKISDAGIRTDETQKADITALPHYLGSFGFFHLKADEWETVLIKGVFKGNIRKIKGEAPYEDKILNELAQTLADIERCLRQPAEVGLTYDGGHFIVISAETREQPFIPKDARDFNIPSPLTPVEASLGRNAAINEKHLFAKSPFASFTGETLSPFANSLAENLTDIINPLFMSSAIKTHSPSIKLLYGRMYMNITNTDTITSAFYAKPDFFYMNFLPAVFRTIAKPSFDVPNLSVLDMNEGEFDEALTDISKAAEEMTRETLFSEEFIQTAALCFMTWEMAYLNMWQCFTEIHKLTKDTDAAMRHLYKTKNGCVLSGTRELMPSFDPAHEPVTVTLPESAAVQPEEMFKTLPSAKRMLTSKTKYIKLLSDAHTALDNLDRVFLGVSGLTMKIRGLLLELGSDMVENQILTNPKDVFYLEYTEIKNIADDSFYGNIPFTLNFRKWQNHRQSALCMPAYLFEKDVENIPEIVKNQIEKSESSKTIPCQSFFHREQTTDNFICRNSYLVSDIQNAVGKDAVIAESASVFSYIARYCAVTDTPLYTGARYAALLTRDKKITFEKDNLKI